MLTKVLRATPEMGNIGQYWCWKKCFEGHGQYWAIFMLTKVLPEIQMLGNICVEKSASSDTNVGQYSCWKKCFERHKCWAIFVLEKVLRATWEFCFWWWSVRLFSRRFVADKQVGAQSGFGGQGGSQKKVCSHPLLLKCSNFRVFTVFKMTSQVLPVYLRVFSSSLGVCSLLL